MWQWFAERDHAVLVPNRLAQDDPGPGQGRFAESHLDPGRTINDFAVPDERRVEVRDRGHEVLKIRPS
jgi:hypothetical protein